jgi:hypothetical protein
VVRGGDEREIHGQASAGGVIGFQGAPHGFGEATGEGKSETDAGRPVSIAGALERQKGSIAFVGRESWAVVDDPDVEPVGVGAGGHPWRLVGW